MVFVLKYPESNGRTDGVDRWSIRQTGIYQSFDSTSRTLLWILLNPRQDTAADAQIKRLLGAQCSSHLQSQPPIVGLIVVSTYFANWRTYMAYYEEVVLRMIDSRLRLSSAMLLIFLLVRYCHQRCH